MTPRLAVRLLFPLFLLFALLFLYMPISHAQDAPADYDPDRVTVPPAPPLARSGSQLFVENCAPCHGETGMGDGPTAASLPQPPMTLGDADALWQTSPAELFYVTKFGRMALMMPPWQQRLNDDQIWQAVSYAWGLHTSREEIALGQTLYEQSCAACHGPGGAGDGPDAEGDLPDFSNLDQAIFTSQADWMMGWQNAHPEIGELWTLQEQRNVLEYVRTFSYIPPWESGYRPGEGVLTGVVRLGSGDNVDSLPDEVGLEAYVDFVPIADFTAPVTEGGSFRFEGLDTDPSIIYFVSARLGEMVYRSPIVQFNRDADTAETVVTVFATTEDDSGISINRMHLIVDPRPGALLVAQIMIFDNALDLTYIGRQIDGSDEPVTVEMAVPPGAMEIFFENGQLGDRFIQIGHRIYDTAPLIPGNSIRQIVMQYVLPYGGTAIDFETQFAYPIENLTVFLAELPNLRVNAPNLAYMTNQASQGVDFQVWQSSGEVWAANRPLRLELGGLQAAGEPDPRDFGGAMGNFSGSAGPMQTMSQLAGWLPLTAGAALLGAILGVLIWAWRRNQDSPNGVGASSDEEVGALREALLQRIADLDDRYESGEIKESDWSHQRAHLKAQLLTLSSR